MGLPPSRAYVTWKVRAINWLRHWTMGHQNDTKDSAGHWNSERGRASRSRLANLLEQAIQCSDGDRAAKIIQHALGIESDDDEIEKLFTSAG